MLGDITLDIRTLIISVIFLNLSLGILLYFFSRIQTHSMGLKEWSFSHLTLGISYIFFAIRGFLPTLSATLIANFLIFVALAYIYIGVKKFLHEEVIMLKVIYIVFIVNTFLIYYFIKFKNSPIVTVYIVSITVVTFLIYYIYKFSTSKIRENKLIAYTGILIFIFHMILLILRMFSLSTFSDNYSIFLSDTFNSIYFLSLLIIDIVRGNLFFMLINAELSEKIKEQKENERNILNEMTAIDSLTGLLNRYKMENIVDKQIANCNLKNTKVSAIMIEINDLKKISEEFGLAEENLILKKLGEILKNSLDKNNYIGRWNRNKFIIIYSDTEFDKVIEKSDLLCKIIENYNFNNQYKISVSFGISEFDKGSDKKNWFHKLNSYIKKSKTSSDNKVEYS